MSQVSEKEQINGLILSFADRLRAYALDASAKHPHDALKNVDEWDDMMQQLLDEKQICNDHLEKCERSFSWYELLHEEILEAGREVAGRNWAKSREELLHVAVVAFRGWLWTFRAEATDLIAKRGKL